MERPDGRSTPSAPRRPARHPREMKRAMSDAFDVFLSHNSRDKPVVEGIASWLRARGLRAWLDTWELRPGSPWQEGLEEGIRASRAVAVCVGSNSLGAWQEPEIRAFITRSRQEQVPVIPVLLPGCPASPQLSLFLEANTWVDLRGGLPDGSLERLVWGITGKRPAERHESAAAAGPPAGPHPRMVTSMEAPPADPPRHQSLPTPRRARRQRSRLDLGIVLGVLGVGATVATCWWQRTPPSPPLPQPALYSVRVQVLDPDGEPVAGAHVRASAGNEPHLLPEGWWEIQVPAAKVPHDGNNLSLWVEHESWGTNRADIHLGGDPNPRVEIQLRIPESWLRGQVVEGNGHAVTGVRVSLKDGNAPTAITDADGHFALRLPVPPDTRVRPRAEKLPWLPEEVFCYSGRDSCP